MVVNVDNKCIFRTIVLGSDHAGFELKLHLLETLREISEQLKTSGIHLQILDIGTVDSEKSVDYPDYASKVVEMMRKEGREDSSKPNYMGILICGTGIGMSIKANRYGWIRAALCHNAEYAKLARAHNDANVLVLGGRYISNTVADEILSIFMSTPFEEGRHSNRIKKL